MITIILAITAVLFLAAFARGVYEIATAPQGEETQEGYIDHEREI